MSRSSQKPRSCPVGEIWPGPGYDGCVPLEDASSPYIAALQAKGNHEARLAIIDEMKKRNLR